MFEQEEFFGELISRRAPDNMASFFSVFFPQFYANEFSLCVMTLTYNKISIFLLDKAIGPAQEV